MKYALIPFGQSGSSRPWMKLYGIGWIRSATGSAIVRSSRTSASPSATGPAQTAITIATFLPCHSSGMTGSGGAVARLMAVVIASGAVGAQSR